MTWHKCDHGLDAQERRSETDVYCSECDRLVAYDRNGEQMDHRDTAVILADETGEPREKFEYDPEEHPLPDPGELERKPADTLEDSIDSALRGDIASADDVKEAFRSDGDDDE